MDENPDSTPTTPQESRLEVPPPWRLRGRGHILLYRFSPDWLQPIAASLPNLIVGRRGNLGAVMLVDYRDSPVGPYRELLLIPGRINTEQGAYYSISHICVSSPASVASGRANWGIPKFLAEIQIDHRQRTIHYRVGPIGQPWADIRIRSGRVPVPFATHWVPRSWRTLWQALEGEVRLTTPQGWGRVSPGRLLSARVDSALFPDFSKQRPLVTLAVQGFTLDFPEPRHAA